MSAPDFLNSSGNLQVDRRYDYAKMLAENGEYDAAIDLLLQTRDLAPLWPVLPFAIGKLCANAGRIDEALNWFRESLHCDPDDHQGAMLEIEILGTPVIQDAMPPAFVETLFDQYAPRFDAHLVETLDYNVPGLIADMIARHCPEKIPARILDLGCGTGLAGEYFAKNAAWIEGVDLSGGMLEQAQKKGVYNALTQTDLITYMQQKSEPFDLIIAADVMSYFGALDSVFDAAAKSICNGGLFIFSVQKLTPVENFAPDYHLNETHRFAHSETYLRRALAAHHLSILACEEHSLRKDRDENVAGLILLCTATPGLDAPSKYHEHKPHEHTTRDKIGRRLERPSGG